MLPRTLKIHGQTYKVRQVSQKVLGGDCMADVNNESNVIRIAKAAAPARKIELVWHEVVHALICGFPLGRDDEEGLVVMLGDALTTFIQANPVFIRHALKVLA